MADSNRAGRKHKEQFLRWQARTNHTPALQGVYKTTEYAERLFRQKPYYLQDHENEEL
jgi:hypothetical protein